MCFSWLQICIDCLFLLNLFASFYVRNKFFIVSNISSLDMVTVCQQKLSDLLTINKYFVEYLKIAGRLIKFISMFLKSSFTFKLDMRKYLKQNDFLVSLFLNMDLFTYLFIIKQILEIKDKYFFVYLVALVCLSVSVSV